MYMYEAKSVFKTVIVVKKKLEICHLPKNYKIKKKKSEKVKTEILLKMMMTGGK